MTSIQNNSSIPSQYFYTKGLKIEHRLTSGWIVKIHLDNEVNKFENFIFMTIINSLIFLNKQTFRTNNLFKKSYQITLNLSHTLKSTNTCLFLQNTDILFPFIQILTWKLIGHFEISNLFPPSRIARVIHSPDRYINWTISFHSFTVILPNYEQIRL